MFKIVPHKVLPGHVISDKNWQMWIMSVLFWNQYPILIMYWFLLFFSPTIDLTIFYIHYSLIIFLILSINKYYFISSRSRFFFIYRRYKIVDIKFSVHNVSQSSC